MSHHKKMNTPASILMRGHHFSGGMAAKTPAFYTGGACKAQSYNHGGDVDPQEIQPTKLRRGGRTKSREHHFWGALAGAVLPSLVGSLTNHFLGGKHARGGRIKGRRCRSKGGDIS